MPLILESLKNAIADAPRERLLTAHEYESLAQMGAFEGQRVELIGGHIITMPPISEDHARSVSNTSEELIIPLRGQMKVRSQNPIDAGEHGRPEPDVAVVPLDYENSSGPPAQVDLLVEVSRSTLAYDQTDKASLYASLGIADYWIVNLVENTVEVRRQPIPRENSAFGHDYASTQIHRRGETVSPLCAPQIALLVDDLLP